MQRIQTKKMGQHPNGTGGAIYGHRTEGNGNSVSGANLCWQSWETTQKRCEQKAEGENARLMITARTNHSGDATKI
jgi:hypothetical protein